MDVGQGQVVSAPLPPSFGSTTIVGIAQLNDSVRSELASMESRFSFDPSVEMTNDGMMYLVRCMLKREQVPPMRIVIPRNYPNALPTVERAVLDLESFYYDDLQNAIHDQLNKLAPRNIVDILNTWDNTVASFSSNQVPSANFEDFSFGELA